MADRIEAGGSLPVQVAGSPLVYRLAPLVAGGAAVLLGVTVLAGWAVGVPALTRLIPGEVIIRPNAALGFVLSGTALLLLAPIAGRPGRRRTAGRVAAASAALVGGLTLLEYVLGLDLGIDLVLFRQAQLALPATVGGRMGANAALNFTLLGCACLLLDVGRRFKPAEPAAVVVGLVALTALVGHMFGEVDFYALRHYTPMAIPGAIVFAALAAGLLHARPAGGLMGVISNPAAGGALARRLLPWVLVMPPLIGWLRLRGERAGYFDLEFGLSIMVVSSVLLLALVVLGTARSLTRSDLDRHRVAAELAHNEALRQAEARQADELRRARDAAEAANKELEAFAYSVSHDLRAPLRAIDGFSQALLEDYAARLDAGGRHYLDRVRANAQRMAQLIDDLLDLSRVSRSALQREAVDLSALAREIVAELRRAQPDRQVEVVIADGLRAVGDGRLLAVALQNLLGNAWKFTARQARARIELGRTNENGHSAFFVKDDGAGFDMRYVDKLFGAFQRLHSPQEFEGNGIGLATVQRIVRRHGGRVWATGEVGNGATFYFTVP
jgi:signal transduction histidine kinase